jgi:hypothetical protein
MLDDRCIGNGFKLAIQYLSPLSTTLSEGEM